MDYEEPGIDPYIFKTVPYLRPKVWGGTRLETVFDKAPQQGESPYGESWEVADLEEGESLVASGPLEGNQLSKVVGIWGDKLLGTTDFEAFPLLVKIIDAARDLSVQVHPGRQDIRKHNLDGDSKEECWLILDADDDGSILYGFEKQMTPEQFRRAVRKQRAAEVLRRVDVEPGDLVHVTPGTVHAICGGVSLLEVQEPSDTTYRVYDYGRPGRDGTPRELHLERALKVADFSRADRVKLSPEETTHQESGTIETLLRADPFCVTRLTLEDSMSLKAGADVPSVLFALEGPIRIEGPNRAVRLDSYETAVIPSECRAFELYPVGAQAVGIWAGPGKTGLHS